MGKDYKQRAAYRYLHGIGDIPKKMLIRIFKKWNRHNFDIGEMRADKVDKIDKILVEDMINELKQR